MDPKEINFDLQIHEKNTEELKARMFALQFSRSFPKAKGTKPFSVMVNSIPQDNWKSYKVMLVKDKSKNVIVEVCFPSDKKENFAVVVESGNNNNCQNKIKDIEKYKIIDNKTQEMKAKVQNEKKAVKESKLN